MTITRPVTNEPYSVNDPKAAKHWYILPSHLASVFLQLRSAINVKYAAPLRWVPLRPSR
jgi:hypothetical protein